MKFILVLSLLLSTVIMSDASAQEAIVSVNVPDMEERIYEGEEGPNRKTHEQTYYRFGVSWDYENSSNVLLNMPHRSFEIASGYWVKRKLNNTFALTIDNSLNFKNIRLQEAGQIWGEFQEFSKESIFLYQYGLFASLRINYDARRRGDFLGFYTDFGAFLNMSYLRRHKAVDKKDGFFQLAREKSINNNPSYIHWFEFGPEFRIGKDFFVLFTRYRVNSILKNDVAGGRDLPKFTSGVIFTF